MRGVRVVRLAAILLLALGAAGCARLFHAYDLAPNGMHRSDDGLRRMLASGQADLAVERLLPERDSPSDELLRHLYHASALHYAGRWGESNAHLQAAADLADDRLARSLSRHALAMVSNDRVLQYEPGRTERLLIPYYGALNYLRLGDIEAAAVEARRIALLLQRFESDRTPAEKPLHAALRELTGAVFESAGDWNDADVAYRNAEALGRTVQRKAPDGGGYALVIVENGFVSHRVEASLNVMLHGDEVAMLAGGDAEDRLAIAGFVAGRVLAHAAFGPSYDSDGRHFGDVVRDGRRGGGYGSGTALFIPAPEESAVRRLRRSCEGEACTDSIRDEAPYLLRAAWPTFRTESRAPRALRLSALAPGGVMTGTAGGAPVVLASNGALPPAGLAGSNGEHAGGGLPAGDGGGALLLPAALGFADVSGAVISDFERVRSAIIARTVLRGAAKLAVTRSAERRLAEKDETAGRILGIIGNAGNALLEQADTRSWHLLPAGIAIVRVPLPAGEHRLVLGGDGGAGAALDLGVVTIAAGRTTFVSGRHW
jgi:hypothetical protein